MEVSQHVMATEVYTSHYLEGLDKHKTTPTVIPPVHPGGQAVHFRNSGRHCVVSTGRVSKSTREASSDPAAIPNLWPSTANLHRQRTKL